jgi:2-keto-4-pentenoate hydratase/2-oxohepta-3-ene-1,7-dioic acid hydratase in catechol pathway
MKPRGRSMPSVLVYPQNTFVPINTIFCIGRNYVSHIQELGNAREDTPVVFLKPTSSVILEGTPIRLPGFSNNVHHEVELVALLREGGKNIPESEALQHVMAYGIGLDLTARDTQDELKTKGLPWTIAKGFDNATCLSQFWDAYQFGDPQQLHFSLQVNGLKRQEGNTSMMIFPVARLISFLSSVFTLSQGDLIFTGTPAGVGPIATGDELKLELQAKVYAQFHVM